MKIGLVCPYDIFRGGGVQEHVLAQAEELRKRGHQVIVITPRPRRAPKEAPAHTVFIGSSATVKTPISTSLELGATFAPNEVDDLLAREKFDILHVHEPEVPMMASQIIAKADCPIVATFHAVFPDTPLAKTIGALRIPYSKSIFSRFKAITAVSDVAAKFVREQTGKRVLIVPNGIDLAKYKRLTQESNNDEKQSSILYVGRLEKRKGVIYLIKAFSLLAKKNKVVSLQIVGDGPDKAKLKQFVKNNNIPRVHFLGFVDEAKKIELLNNATLFCSPALYGESFGIVLLEAMALETVLVAGNNDGYSGVMRGAGAISLVDPKDTKAFSEKLNDLLYDQKLRQNWRKWAKDYIQQFSYEKIVDKYEALYKRISEANSKV